MTAAWKETEREHKNYMAEKIKTRNEKLNEAKKKQRQISAPVDQTGLPDADCDN